MGRGYWAAPTAAGRQKLAEARPTHLAGVRQLLSRNFHHADLARLARYWDREAGAGRAGDAEPGDARAGDA